MDIYIYFKGDGKGYSKENIVNQIADAMEKVNTKKKKKKVRNNMKLNAKEKKIFKEYETDY